MIANSEKTDFSQFNKVPVPIALVRTGFADDFSVNSLTVEFLNESFTELSHDFDDYLAVTQNFMTIIPPALNLYTVVSHVLQTNTRFENDFRCKGNNKWYHLVIQKYNEEYCIFIVYDITASKMTESVLKKYRNLDLLTGLFNYIRFKKDLDKAIEYSEKENKNLALVLMDLDNLGTINDLYGREFGSEIIITCGEILQSYNIGKSMAYRLEGDEFAVIIRDAEEFNGIEAFVRQLFFTFSESQIKISMGIAVASPEMNFQHLFRNAHLALTEVKRNGKNDYDFFRESMYRKFLSETDISIQIEKALENNEFELYFQPQYFLDGKNLRGFESLIRWHDHKAGIRMPSDFIPAAEQTNAIHALGDWILENAIKTLGAWQKDFSFKGILSVNISSLQLLNPIFMLNLQKHIDKYEINPAQLELEITESIFISDTQRALGILEKIHNMGIKISLDDFGTGYSSLQYLAKLPAQTLKIDKTFIDELVKEKDGGINKEILNAVFTLCRNSKIETIAEGVELPEQLSILNGMNCNCVQGFLWGKPLCKSECEKLFSN